MTLLIATWIRCSREGSPSAPQELQVQVSCLHPGENLSEDEGASPGLNPRWGPQWTGDALQAWSLERQLFGLFFEPGGRPRRLAAPVFFLAVRFAVAVPFEDVFR